MLDERVVMTVSIFCRCCFRFIGCWSCVYRCLLVRDKTGRPNICINDIICLPNVFRKASVPPLPLQFMLNTPKT